MIEIAANAVKAAVQLAIRKICSATKVLRLKADIADLNTKTIVVAHLKIRRLNQDSGKSYKIGFIKSHHSSIISSL